MKLSQLYTNHSALFQPVRFNPGLNVILAEIRLPENRRKDTHNLGKTTLGRLLDYCFLANRNPNFFLFKHKDLFHDFIFFLEVQLPDNSYLTIRRGVKKHSKIGFKKHREPIQDFKSLPDAEWDHLDLPIAKARNMLDSLLDWRGLKPWSYRKGLGYQLRSQGDFGDVFRLQKFVGKHSEWKPFLAHVMGFDAKLVEKHYQKEAQRNKRIEDETTVRTELGGSIEDISKIEGILLLKQEEVEKKQKLLNSFDFRTQDLDRTKQLVDQIDQEIAELNAKRYSLKVNLKKIQKTLGEEQILFNPDEAQALFEQAGVYFQGQIKKDFQQLISFNQAITEERFSYLEEERRDIEAELQRINESLDSLGKRRSDILGFLSDTDVFNKYKQMSAEVVTLRADIATLERQRQFLDRLREYRTDIRKITETLARLQTQIENHVERQNEDKGSLFTSIRRYFNEIVEEVIDSKALLSVSPNKHGHLDFRAEILGQAGLATSADLGHTYRKLLCIAFDLAVLRAHLDEKFPRFVFHDGIFESLDDRKKENLLSILRRYVALGIQPIITLIDSDLPHRGGHGAQVFDPSEIVLLLHDEDKTGRLFKMEAW